MPHSKAKHRLWQRVLCSIGVGLLIASYFLTKAADWLNSLSHRWDPERCKRCDAELTDANRGSGLPPPIMGRTAHHPTMQALFAGLCIVCNAWVKGEIDAGDLVYECTGCKRIGLMDRNADPAKAVRRMIPDAAEITAIKVPVCPRCDRGESQLVALDDQRPDEDPQTELALDPKPDKPEPH